MGNKPKTTQPITTNKVQGRDLFQTPNYATELLIPYIPKRIEKIWECATGNDKITNVLINHKYLVYSSDLSTGTNFLDAHYPFLNKLHSAIITNPPFSLKYKFIEKAIEHDVAFAFLIPFDMCQKMAELFSVYECQGLIPTRRIDYITPTGKSGATGHSAYYHSFWITRNFNLPQQLTFVDLSIQEKKNNI